MKNKLKEIKTQLLETANIVADLSGYNEIPDVDIELLKQKVIGIYDKILTIKNQEIFDNELIADEIKEDVIKIIDEKIENLSKQINTISKTKLETENLIKEIKEKTDIKIQEEKESENIEKETVVNKKTEIIETPEPKVSTEEKIEEEIENENKPEIETQENMQKTEQKIEEKEILIGTKSKLSSIFKSIQDGTDLASKLQLKPVKDIKTALSINDKIGITREIFAGDNNKFNICLDRINSFNAIDDAINELELKTEWDLENPVHKIFLELIYRKFL